MSVNLIIVFDKTKEKVLMCKRRKEPYKGLLNFVGGKAEKNETSEQAAYRELFEETGIPKSNIKLEHLMDSIYYIHKLKLEIYFGYLKEDFTVYGDENELLWINRKSDFFNTSVFAGKGNLGHFMKIIEDMEN